VSARRRQAGAALACPACDGPLYAFCPRCRGRAGGRVGGTASTPEKAAAARKAARARWRREQAKP
jgi:hypothetical protein